VSARREFRRIQTHLARFPLTISSPLNIAIRFSLFRFPQNITQNPFTCCVHNSIVHFFVCFSAARTPTEICLSRAPFTDRHYIFRYSRSIRPAGYRPRRVRRSRYYRQRSTSIACTFARRAPNTRSRPILPTRTRRTHLRACD